MKVNPVYLVAGGLVAAALAWAIWNNKGGAMGVGQALGGAAVDLVDGAVTGVVVGAGGLVGIPATSRTQCEIDKANGDTWAASFSCPAKDFLSYVWS